MTTQLKEHPVVFTAEEVNAVLAGNKTQHRIPCLTKEQVLAGFSYDFNAIDNAAIFLKVVDDEVVDNLLVDCPFGADGGRLWVQEEHRPTGWSFDDGDVRIQYKDGKDSLCEIQTWEEVESNPNDDYLIAICDELINRNVPMKEGTDCFDMEDKSNLPHWRNAEDMPRFASRAFLEITDIRIERVQDITHNDSVAEYCFNFGEKKKQCIPPLTGFSSYWRERHGDDAWRSNPWVWVVEFKKVEG